MNILLRTASVADIPQIKTLQPHNWGDIIPNVRFYLNSSYCYLIVAVQDGVILGCGAAIQHQNCIWLAGIIVGDAHRGLGLGTMITSHLFEYARLRSETIILIATDLGYPIYKRLGFQDDEVYTFFEERPREQKTHSNIFSFDAGFTKDILQLDYEATGEWREQLLIPRLPNAHIYLQDNQLLGFCIPDFGEGLALAQTAEAGQALMAFKASDRAIFALPKSNTNAISHALFLGNQLISDRKAIKMYWGKQLKWNPLWQYGRIGGNLG